ncbi:MULTISPECIES: hypothetical protein [Nocardia]|uniref:Uncharacterized protein n=1 Tax=Nocardia nova TaxID=37330 RepID=A0A2T2Z8B4_9NOCA|nr:MULTISPECIES: hypothetical protein [Nocardia]PSR64002.1 hypothetical protein C8259_09145 [Nocardia nova]
MIPPDDTLIEIEGPRGQMWTVAGEGQWDQGVALADEEAGTDFDGMFDVPTTALYNSTAFQIGADFDGIREDKYDFVLAFEIEPANGLTVAQVDSLFRTSFSFKRDSKIWVTANKSRRHLPVRLGGKPRIKSNNDPNSEKGLRALMPLVGRYPRWIEAPQPSSFYTETDTTGGGTETGYVWIDNPLPEDYDAWPIWEVQASYEGVTVKLPDYSFGSDLHERAEEDALRKVPLAPLHLGEHLRITTDPMSMGGQYNTATKSEYAGRMNGLRFMYPIPGGTPRQQVPITVTGAPKNTRIRVTVPREWPRPWGMDE